MGPHLSLLPPPPSAPPLVVAPAGFRLPTPAEAGFRLPTPAEVATGPALFGRTVLHYWPCCGWVRGTVARRSGTQGFSHVVGRRDGRLATRCRLARAGLPLGPAVPDAVGRR